MDIIKNAPKNRNWRKYSIPDLQVKLYITYLKLFSELKKKNNRTI